MGRLNLPHLIFTKIFGIIILEREKEIIYPREEEFLKMPFHLRLIAHYLHYYCYRQKDCRICGWRAQCGKYPCDS